MRRAARGIMGSLLSAVTVGSLTFAGLTAATHLMNEPGGSAMFTQQADSVETTTHSNPTLSPGDRIYINAFGPESTMRKTCTVTYVDSATRTAATAGHCAEVNSPVYDEARNLIGAATRNPGAKDIATISLSNTVKADAKDFTRTKPNKSMLGQRVCTIGATTRVERCGRVIDIDKDGKFNATAGLRGKSGDSGGPVWTDNKQLIGIYAGGWSQDHTPIVGGYGYFLD